MRSPIEKETVILFNEAEETADIYTHDKRLKRRLTKLSQEFPGSVRFKERNEDDGERFVVDKQLITIRKPYSEERKEKDRERAIAENRISFCNNNIKKEENE